MEKINITLPVEMVKWLKEKATQTTYGNVSAVVRSELEASKKSPAKKTKDAEDGDDPGHHPLPVARRVTGVSGFTMRK